VLADHLELDRAPRLAAHGEDVRHDRRKNVLSLGGGGDRRGQEQRHHKTSREASTAHGFPLDSSGRGLTSKRIDGTVGWARKKPRSFYNARHRPASQLYFQRMLQRRLP